MVDYLVPLILLLTALLALRKQENCYDILLSGAAEGLALLKTILPSLILLLTAVSMFRASGGAEVLSRVLEPVLSLFGIPPECAMLVLVRTLNRG